MSKYINMTSARRVELSEDDLRCNKTRYKRPATLPYLVKVSTKEGEYKLRVRRDGTHYIIDPTTRKRSIIRNACELSMLVEEG